MAGASVNSDVYQVIMSADYQVIMSTVINTGGWDEMAVALHCTACLSREGVCFITARVALK